MSRSRRPRRPRATRPKANPPICWLCDRRLWNPRAYVLVRAEDGRQHPAHHSCAERYQPPLTADLKEAPMEETYP